MERSSFAVVAREGGPRALAPTLKRMFSHPWVASYMIGFGPPLIRSSERVIARLKDARGAFDKLDIYVEECLLDEEERRRLMAIHRRSIVRARGPVEAEELDEASAEVIDLSMRLHHPAFAAPAVSQAMRARGIGLDVVPMKSPPEALTARVLVRLADPRGSRLLDTAAVRALVDEPEAAVAIEMRVPPPVRGLYASYLAELGEGIAFVHFSDPAALARVTRDGERS
jgi:hypothetical protein